MAPFAVALAVAAVGGGTATAAEPPLPLSEAVRTAVERAASLASLDASARGLREAAVAAGQRPDPVLRLALENVPVDGPERFSTARDFMTMRSVGVMQMLTREDKRRARSARVEREADALGAERSARAAEIERRTAAAWFERHAREQQVALLQEHLQVAAQQVEAADAAVRGGRDAIGDAIAARDAVVQLRQALLAAEAGRSTARRELARWTGTAADRPLAPAPSIAQAPRSEALGDDAVDRHPDLARLAAREATADAAIELARQEREPDWGVELMFSQRGSRYSNMASVALTVPLPWDRPQRQDRTLAARLAEAEAVRSEREELARALQAQIGGWRDGWRAALERLALIDAEREPLAQQRLEAAMAAYRGGRAPLAEVLAARRMALALQQERIDTALEAARHWAQLEHLLPTGPTTAATE